MTSVSKNVYIDKLDDIINKYNNAYHSTIKMKPVDVKSSTYIDFCKENNNEDSKFKLMILLEYQKIKNIKRFLQRVTLKIGLERFLSFKNLEMLCCRHMLLMILTEKKFLGRFTKTNCKKRIKKEFRIEKVIKREGDK